MVVKPHTSMQSVGSRGVYRSNPRIRPGELNSGGVISTVSSPVSSLQDRSTALFGALRRGLPLHIMVTLPDDAGSNRPLLKSLLRAGMSIARINCAQDGPQRWKIMIRNLRAASRDTGIPCTVLMDLSGPKLRTGRMTMGPPVLHLRPRRDALGQTTSPALVWLGSRPITPLPNSVPVISLPTAWIKGLRKGDKITCLDARGKRRTLVVGRSNAGGRYAELRETAYLQTGTNLRHVDAKGVKRHARVGALPSAELRIQLRKGDLLFIHKDPHPGEPALSRPGHRTIQPAHVSCTLPEAVDAVKKGEPVVFDNGIIAGLVERVIPDGFFVRIRTIAGATATLRADKGINLPQTKLPFGGLTVKDRKDLQCAGRYADLVSLSFVRSPDDVVALQQELAKLRGKRPGVIIKIETQHAVRNLPAILSAVSRLKVSGIMMARGDLAVEYGWERLPALQRSLLAMTHAARLPLVIATEILETMAKKGIPSRAELNDVAMAADAQCILLGKGPHVVAAVRMAGKVLQAFRTSIRGRRSAP
jgi:pyruvate kinase